MAWETRTVETLRKQLVELYREGDLTMTEICHKFGISRKTGYKWLKRYEDLSDLGLVNLSKAPLVPNRIFSNEQVDTAISMKKKYPKWGPKKILVMLARAYPDQQWPSATRLYEIFKESNLVIKRRLRRKVPATHPLGEVVEVNDIWMGDFKGWFRTTDKCKCEPMTITDGYSRFVIRSVHVNSKKSENIWGILDGAFREYGLPKRFRTDNGPPFGSVGAGRLTPLSVNLIKAGVLPEWIEPGHPEQNGRHERFHLTLKQAIADPPAETLDQQLRRMEGFVHEYNFDRPHESLDMKTPATYYSSSSRKWDGVLRSPEYDNHKGHVRKVAPSGGIWFAGKNIYVSRGLAGEYVLIKKEDMEGNKVFYGPVYLGSFLKKNSFVTPIGRQKQPIQVLPM